MKKTILAFVLLGTVIGLGCGSNNGDSPVNGAAFGVAGVLRDGNGDPIGGATVWIECPSGTSCPSPLRETERAALGNNYSCDLSPNSLLPSEIFSLDCTDTDDAADDGIDKGNFALLCPGDKLFSAVETNYLLPPTDGFNGQSGTFQLNCGVANQNIDIDPTPTPIF